MSKSSFTVYFEGPFWVGLYERAEGGRLSVCKVTFGPEPKDGEVYEFLLRSWHRLAFGPAMQVDVREVACKNPKRMRRMVARQLERGVGTKAQQALSLAREATKRERQEASRACKAEAAQRRYELRAAKKKEKHKGH